ncbi:3-hydroxyacyl-CoA dehydrogenase/enoyl-CoA hydratase family protein [Halapricum hydrolyticum]|uniref:enoyl-CoA hydratase n=1 Tax=Halapricum hydrolyticum TaxID=2979991 RepID=A0AAE3IBT2_9EURY|nr:3-hydroxyacyl-CoA dehydrogenase NAD-binding domain-containing protein [Halapricum hydrolyticum]MCU4718250.1 3-hydroxyacyl-CoA dehydrogenase/enoyl-CoA hydratase family protein [Halapricum hydrolyticum]MCU4727302.1 3-hydroxyacyl-CoA dehydrogenase/enoyl-CoA hydratase family protein [Halapricum hydrolyticum]
MNVDDITRVAVLGAGSMGHGIAEVAALAGYEVALRDIDEDLVQDGYENIEWSVEKLAEKDRLDEDPEVVLDRITPLVDLEAAVGDADVVIEAVPEVMDIKTEVYGSLEEYAPDRAIFATNTSSLSITDLSEMTDRPEQFCGMHFFNPPVRMQLVEVITGKHTSEETLETVEALAESFDKTSIRVRKDSPGFVVNRILTPLLNEACWAVNEGGADIRTVDSTGKYDIGIPMGPFELADRVGNDVAHHVLEYLNSELGEAYEPCPLLTEKIDEGKFGEKTGEGWYDHDEGVEIPADAGEGAIERRLLAVLANETAKLIEDSVAPIEDIDEAMMLGAGFPDGPGKLADAAGVETLVETLEGRHAETGHPRYEVSDGLREIADNGGFYADDEGEASGRAYEQISVEIDGRVGHIEIDRPHRMNSITVQMLEEIEHAVEALEEDDDVRSLLVSGAGDRAFSAGFDAASAAPGSGLEATEISRYGQQVTGAFEECPKPVVAAIDGYCLGGGMELATGADLRVASERAQFGQPEHNLGLLPGWGGTQRLSAIVGEGRAKEIIFTARNDYDAETMADYGFVNEVVENESFEERARELARELAAGPPIAQKFTKRAMHAGRDDTGAGLEVEAAAFGHLFTTDDVWEGLAAFQQDRDPEFEGQ